MHKKRSVGVKIRSRVLCLTYAKMHGSSDHICAFWSFRVRLQGDENSSEAHVFQICLKTRAAKLDEAQS
ncbi:hypothetical protein D3C78_1690170 [compost metagenome]